MKEDDVSEFHAHLDRCSRCEKRPWDLCPVGLDLLQAAGAEISKQYKHLYPTLMEAKHG
jgi:hypothetical protein